MPLIPFVRGGSYFASQSWTPTVRENGFTTEDGTDEPTEDEEESEEE